MLLADVALPVPLTRAFTYAVPETVAALAVPGARVVCPFGARRVIGVVLTRHEGNPPERAKAIAIKRAIATKQEEGIRENDLQLSFIAEFTENDIFPPTDITEDWLKLIDYDPENVVKIAPVRPLSDPRSRAISGVI